MNQDDITRMAREAGFAHSWSEAAGEALARFHALAVAAERQRIEAAGTSLYERTGDIADINTLLIQRNAIRAMSTEGGAA